MRENLYGYIYLYKFCIFLFYNFLLEVIILYKNKEFFYTTLNDVVIHFLKIYSLYVNFAYTLNFL